MAANEEITTVEAGEASAEQIKQGVREAYAARVSDVYREMLAG